MPLSAVIEIVTTCPTFTFEMSSSLSETVIDIVLSLISSANPELELEPEPLAPVPALPVPEDPVFDDDEELELLPAETLSPIV